MGNDFTGPALPQVALTTDDRNCRTVEQEAALCSTCDLRASDPKVRSCTRRDCPMCERRPA